MSPNRVPRPPGRIDRFALIIGAMKAGTTTLFRALKSHPQVAPCEPKEPEFFSRESNFRRGRDWYEGLFGWDAARHTLAVEGSTGYTKPEMHPLGLERLRNFDADLRFLYMVRNPLDRIESHYRHSMSRPFFRPEPGGRPADRLIDISDYPRQLDPYRDAFGRSRILVLRLDDLRDDAAATLARVHGFLGVRPTPTPVRLSAVNRTEHRLVIRPFWQRTWSRLPAGGLRRAILRIAQPGVPPPWLRPMFFTDRIPVYQMAPEVRLEVQERLRPAMQRLRREWQIDVSPWGF